MCGLNITDRQIKKKMLECNLPRTAIFNGLTLPTAIQPYFAYRAESESDDEDDEDELALTPVIVQKWYNLGGLDGKAPLNTGKNKSLLLSCEMDCNKPCMPDKSGTMKKVPYWRRTEMWGFSEEERSTKKKTGALTGDASERRVPPAADGGDGDAKINSSRACST
jgi:hypothetical protein